MALAQSWSIALVGLEGHLVEVEADIASGLPRTTLIGLPDTSLSEARDRVRAAVSNSGHTFPNRKLTVGLSPATLPKAGSHYDVAIACAVLAADDAIPAEPLRTFAMVGELGLDGRVREVRGVLAMTLAAANAGFEHVIVPELNVGEARLVPGIAVIGVRSLRQVLAIVTGEPIPDEPLPLAEPRLTPESLTRPVPDVDLRDVIGQEDGRFAIEVAAAGGHHVFLHGPPGAGKTMLAERLPGLLPELGTEQALEVSTVHSLAGLLSGETELVTRPPYIAPHHTASLASLVGGGSGMPRPGAISCAHRGVLFIDEAAEMHPLTLDTLRQPLESGYVELHRSIANARFPARFLLVLAANPCPCGQADTPRGKCECPRNVVLRYQHRISAPVRDRIDISRQILPMPSFRLDRTAFDVDDTATVAARVLEARDRQAFRFAGQGWRLNSELPGPVLRRELRLEDRAYSLLETEYALGRLTARGIDRVLRVAWTLADLRGVERPDHNLVQEANQLRSGMQVSTGRSVRMDDERVRDDTARKAG
ncbi:MAG TPA: YifB family Mg chelatase-like AAA ATPase [Kribbellaceae bacterium]|nr:YifB family Mg chelatase-like AAA ATPase [Kribbellaceae bacterium]